MRTCCAPFLRCSLPDVRAACQSDNDEEEEDVLCMDP